MIGTRLRTRPACIISNITSAVEADTTHLWPKHRIVCDNDSITTGRGSAAAARRRANTSRSAVGSESTTHDRENYLATVSVISCQQHQQQPRQQQQHQPSDTTGRQPDVALTRRRWNHMQSTWLYVKKTSTATIRLYRLPLSYTLYHIGKWFAFLRPKPLYGTGLSAGRSEKAFTRRHCRADWPPDSTI